MPRSPRRARLGALAFAFTLTALSTGTAAVALAAPASADVACPPVTGAAFDGTAPGTVTAVFVVGCETELTLTSPNAAARDTFAAGAGSLSVPVPDCGAEVVLSAGGTVVAEAATGEPCGPAPAAEIGDALCLEQGALVELANTGDVPVTFTIQAGSTVVHRAVPAAGEGSEIVRLPAGVTEVTVSAPGMDPVTRRVDLVCTEVAAEVVEATPVALQPAPAPASAPAHPSGATLPRTGASTTTILAVVGTTLLLTGLALLRAPVVGRRRVAAARQR